MKLARKFIPILAMIIAAGAMVACDFSVTLDWLSAPYGYVQDSAGVGVEGASVKVSKGATLATAIQIQTTVTTGTNGYFTLTSKVDSVGGTYFVEVTPPANSKLTYEPVEIKVPDSTYLFNIGTIKPNTAFSVTGTVLDARVSAETGVTGVAITLTAGTTTYTATTATGGAYAIANVVPGEYKLTGAKDGYFVAPIDVTISTAAQVLPKVQAFALDFNDYYGLSFILTWNEKAVDIDAHLTYPKNSTADAQSTWSTDLYPAIPARPNTTNRGIMNYAAISTPYTTSMVLSGGKSVYMDRDDTSAYGPETINLVAIPKSAYKGGTDITFTSTATFGFDPAVYGTSGTASYEGTSVLYLNAYTASANLSDLGSLGAAAKVYVIQTVPKTGVTTPTSNAQVQASLLGIYEMPANTTIEAASIVNVNMFVKGGTEYFQILPNLKILEKSSTSVTTQFRGISSDIINVRGRSL